MKIKLFAALFMVLSLFATSAFAADANTTNTTTNETVNETILIEENETIEINESINDTINTTVPNESIDDALNDTLNDTEQEELENEYEGELANISAGLPGGFGRFIARVGDAFTFNETKKAERAMERVRENKLRILKRMHDTGTGFANTKYADELEKLQQYIDEDLAVAEETVEDGETEDELGNAVGVSNAIQRISVLDNMIQKQVNETFNDANFTNEQKQRIEQLVSHVEEMTKKAHTQINEKKVNTAARVIASGKNLEDVKELKNTIKEKAQNRGKPEWAGKDDEEDEEDDENGTNESSNNERGKPKWVGNDNGDTSEDNEDNEDEQDNVQRRGKPEWVGNDDEEDESDDKNDEEKDEEDDNSDEKNDEDRSEKDDDKGKPAWVDDNNEEDEREDEDDKEDREDDDEDDESSNNG